MLHNYSFTSHDQLINMTISNGNTILLTTICNEPAKLKWTACKPVPLKQIQPNQASITSTTQHGSIGKTLVIV